MSPLFRNRDYMLLWSGQVASTLGTTASQVVVPLLILAITASPEAAGIAGALRFLPYVVFSLPVGALIDRWDRKAVMIRCDIGRAIAVASIPLAMAFDMLTLWQIYAVSLIEGTLFVFFNIAEVAALPRVVPAGQLPQASAQNEVAYGIANIIGPSFGATLYQTLGRAVPFLGNVVTYAVSALALMRIKTPFSASRTDSSPLDLRAEVAEGLRWMWGNRLIRFMALLTGCWNMVTAAMPLIIIVLAQALGVGDAAIGAIFSGAAVGGIAGSLVGGQIRKHFTFGQVICAVMWIEVVSFPLLIVAPSALLLGAIASVNYFVGPIYNVVQFSYRLAIIPDRLQGRVNSVFRLLAFGFVPIGAALSGILIERVGATMTIAAFGVWLLLLAIATTLNRHVRNAPPVEEAVVSASN